MSHVEQMNGLSWLLPRIFYSLQCEFLHAVQGFSYPSAITQFWNEGALHFCQMFTLFTSLKYVVYIYINFKLLLVIGKVNNLLGLMVEISGYLNRKWNWEVNYWCRGKVDNLLGLMVEIRGC